MSDCTIHLMAIQMDHLRTSDNPKAWAVIHARWAIWHKSEGQRTHLYNKNGKVEMKRKRFQSLKLQMKWRVWMNSMHLPCPFPQAVWIGFVIEIETCGIACVVVVDVGCSVQSRECVILTRWIVYGTAHLQ